MSPPHTGPGDPTLAPLPFSRPLAGPGETARLTRADEGIDAVTGGGLVALLDPTRGLRSLWRGPVQVAGQVRLRWGRRPLHPASGLRLGSGGWERRIPLPGDDPAGELVERGVLVDSAPAVLIQWTREGGSAAPLTVELQPPAGRTPIAVELAGDAPSAGVVIVPPGEALDELRPRLAPPHARERARQTRLGEGLGPVDGASRAFPSTLRDALHCLADAALGMDVRGDPAAPLLLGVQDGRPRFARGTELAEVGIGAIQAGWPSLGWTALEALLARSQPPPLASLHLASELVRWTGELDRLAHLRRLLEGPTRALVEAAERPASDPPAALPGPARILARLAEGVQRLGDGWTDELTEARTRLLQPAGTGDGGPRRRLPVLGAPSPSSDWPTADARPTLPPPHAFAPVWAPGIRHHRTLHAARLVRSWIEGRLGADADASYGRLTLAPDLTATPSAFGLRGLRVGGPRVGLDCRHDRRTCSIRVFQEGGRIPLNVVFKPTVPLAPPVNVSIGGETADVSATPVEGGVSLSLQFPLDPERRIVIERTR